MLDELKIYLDITWTDDVTDKKIEGILTRAISTLQSYAGYEINFKTEQNDKQLLFDCCRYIYNNALEDFKTNFHAELVMLRAKYQVKNMPTEEEAFINA